MTSEQRERAEHAKRLLTDDLFADMLSEVRMDALNKLAVVNAGDTSEINRLQAIVKVTSDIHSMLMAVIIATGEQDGGYSQTNPPQGE